MKKLTSISIFMAFTAFAQAQDLAKIAGIPSTIDLSKTYIESSKHWLDVDYVGDKHIGHRLDVHLPKKGKAPFPIVVVVYGSAWFSNNFKGAAFFDPEMGESIGQYLLKAGFGVVTVNHRSSRDSIFPAQIQDVKAAIRFIRANAAIFSLDNRFVGITGWSSGGHLSALAAATNGLKTFKINNLDIDIEGKLGKYTETSSHVDAVVDWFGPTDFLIMDKCGSAFKHDDEKSPESSVIGGKIQENPDKVVLANPITYVRKDNPPFLIIHGDKDPLVNHCQSEKLFEQLQKQGVQSELIVIKDGGHGPKVMIPTYYAKMVAFFKAKINKK